MEFRVADEIFRKFQGLNIGLVVAKGIDNAGSSKDVEEMLRKIQEQVRGSVSAETLSQDPKIAAWRKAYSSFGAKPKKYKCSVENMYRLILNDTGISHINKIVDIYNYVSLKHTVPMGGDDIDKVDGNIVLKFADGSENFTPLNSDKKRRPKKGEVVYADDEDILCRRWNWRECDKSKMTENTKNVALVVEGLPPVTEDEIKRISDELSELVRMFCGGGTESLLLDETKSRAAFQPERF